MGEAASFASERAITNIAFMAASGALANRYGGKIVLGAAVLWWSIFTALTPPAALVSF